MRKVMLPGAGSFSFEVFPPELETEVEELITQSLSRLLGWDTQHLQWTPLAVDSQGGLRLSNQATALAGFTTSQRTVTTSAIAILNSFLDRAFLRIFNYGPETVFLRTNASAPLSSAYPLFPGDEFVLEGYLGEIWGITTSGSSDLRCFEGVL